MTARRRVLAVTISAAIALVWSGAAFAASPQKIYKDLADNGRLDGKYSRADIARAFNLERVVKTDAGKPMHIPPAARARETASTKSSGRKIPFSGLDLALLTVGGGPLLLIGIGLRRRIAPAHSRAEVAG